ncbi:MAG: BrnT family toxin [Betaproteobacteria bacterium]|nr:BrnT family toxin [Betaproteobacteria bacterium]
MFLQFDRIKDQINQQKHGVSLALASELDWDFGIVWDDERIDYGERRQCCLAPIGARLFFVAFVDRDDHRRVISLRKANIREVKFYAEHCEGS